MAGFWNPTGSPTKRRCVAAVEAALDGLDVRQTIVGRRRKLARLWPQLGDFLATAQGCGPEGQVPQPFLDHHLPA